MDITDQLRGVIAGISELSEQQRDDLSSQMDDIDQIHSRMEDERDSAVDRADAAPDEDAIELETRDTLARELEPIFAAIQLGDLDRARGGVRQLAGLLSGNDPIILAIQRAKSRPTLHLHVAA